MVEMQKIKSAEELRAAIVLLENERDLEGKLLRNEFLAAYESIKPINLIKSAVKDITQSDEIKGNILNSGIGLVMGTVVRTIVVAGSKHPLRKLVGSAVMVGVTKLISKNPELVQTASQMVINLVKGKRNNEKTEFQ